MTEKEIEVGEYIRTKNGNIGKIIDINRRNYWIDRYIRKESGIPSEFLERNSEQLKNNIVKHSKNIIDLIEVGDIVNNGYIYEIGNTEDGHKWVHNLNGLLLFENDIKTILTKELYQANCYKVERKV